MDIEYEYSYTNGEIDIDIIYSKKQRKRLLSVKCSKFDVIAPLKGSRSPDKDIRNKIYACSSMNAPELYYAVFLMGDKGKTILYFEPNKEMIADIKKRIPQKIKE